MRAISTIGDLKRAIERYPDNQPVQVLQQAVSYMVGGNNVPMPPVTTYDQLVIQAVFDSPGWHPGANIVRLAIHHQNGVFTHPCVSPTPTVATEPKPDPPAISGTVWTGPAPRDEKSPPADGATVVEGNQDVCPYCGWVNLKIPLTCPYCRKPLPER